MVEINIKKLTESFQDIFCAELRFNHVEFRGEVE